MSDLLGRALSWWHYVDHLIVVHASSDSPMEHGIGISQISELGGRGWSADSVLLLSASLARRH